MVAPSEQDTDLEPKGTKKQRKIPPADQERINETLKFMQGIEDDPSRKAYPDGILPNEVGS